jgi:hypothetical protein
MPPKLFNYLIIVWLVICASGLGVFLFEMFGPGSDVNSPSNLQHPAITVGFWLFLWLVPTIIMEIARRRQEDDSK